MPHLWRIALLHNAITSPRFTAFHNIDPCHLYHSPFPPSWLPLPSSSYSLSFIFSPFQFSLFFLNCFPFLSSRGLPPFSWKRLGTSRFFFVFFKINTKILGNIPFWCSKSLVLRRSNWKVYQFCKKSVDTLTENLNHFQKIYIFKNQNKYL